MTDSTTTTSGPLRDDGPEAGARWVPAVIAAIGCVWAVHYVWQTGENSYGDQDTVLFINFLIWPLVLAGLAVIVSAMRGNKRENTIGLSDPRRLLLVGSVPLYGAAVAYGGFVLASGLYVVIVVRLLGVRNPGVLLGLAALVVAIAWFGFSYLMSVPLPLWPRGLQF